MRERIAKIHKSTSSDGSSSKSELHCKKDEDDELSVHYEIGDRVEGRLQGYEEWVKCKIISMRQDGSYDVRYDDGDEELKVRPEMIRPLGRPRRASLDRQIRRSTDNVKQEGKLDTTMFRQRDDQGSFAELREHKAKTQRSSSSDLRNMRHEASGADNRVDSRISDRTKPVKDDFDGAWQTKTFSGHYVGEHKEEKVNARCKPSSRSGRLHSYSDESSSKGRPSPRELSPEKIELSATGSHEDKYANSDIESHSARYASESKRDGTEASKVARFKTAHRAQFATNAMAWGKDGLLPRALVAKLATVASSMHIFGRIITELYRRDEEETGAISKEDWITILEESSIYLSDEDILCLWQVMGHQQVQKLYYWDLLQLALGECETDELADLHVKLLRRFKLTAPAPKTLHEDLLAFFQKYDRRARGHVPYSLLEKALRRLGVKLEKFERSSILDRFAGCKPYSVQYEACILWMTSGLDTKRTVRKLEHMTELLAAKQQIDLMQLICACDPKGTGTIPAVDFQRILRQHGVALTAGELRALALWYRRGKVGLSYKQITGNLSAICPPPENTASVQKPVLAASVPGVALKRSLRNEDDLKRSQSTPPMQGATSMRAEKWSTQQGPLAPVPTASDFDCSSVVDQLTAKLQQAAEYIKDEVDLWTRLRRRDEENQGAVPMESVREELMGMGVVLESSETECIHVCYGLTQDGRIHYDDIVWLAHERLPESHPLRLDILVAVVRQFFSRNQAPTETFDTLKDYLMAADADEQGHISSADFIRILKRVNNLGLDTRQMSAVCEGFRLRGSLEASMTLGRAELSKDEFTPQSVMSTSTRSMHPPSSFALRFPEGSQHHSSDRSAERQISTTALVAQLPPHVNYAEFLLWIDRNCVEDQSERQLLMLKRSVRRHMQKGVDVAEITQNGSGQQGISAEMFGRILASFGFMMSRLSLMSLYHKLARGADHILPEVLLQSLLPEYRTIIFGARSSAGIIPPQSRNPVGHKRALVSSAPYPGNQRSEASARLDAELQSVLGRAMERAFRHFDVDNSNTIDVEDFVEVLRALGQDLSSKEVRSIIKSGRGTDTLHFEEFEKIVYPYLRERLSQECRVSEDALRQLFQAMDNQGSGAIAPQDLKYALVSRLRVMTDLEATAVVDALPIPKGGLICWAEFHRFLRLAQDGCESTSTTDLFRANSEALTALKKLKFGTIPDPDTYLSSLLGMPSNVRESVLASLELKGEHLVEVALRPVVTIDDSGLSIKDLPVRLVPLDNGEPGFLPLKRQRPYHAILQPIGTLQQQADGATSIGQIGLILNGASGIPVPDDRRMPDIVSRNVRACLLLENPTKRRKSQFISNIHNILARQDPNREECWLFPDNDLTSPSMIIRINLAKLHDSDIELAKENLHVLLELSVTVSADPAALTRGKVYYHNDLDEEANNKVKEGISGKASKGTSGMPLRSKLIRRPRPIWQKAWEGRTEHLEQHSTDREAESIDEMLYEGGHTTDSAVETETSRPSSLLDRRRSHQIDKGKGSSPSRRQKIRLKNASHRSSRPTKGSRPAVLRKVPLRKRHQKSTPSKAEVTLSCGWCKLPLLKLAALESEQAQSVDLIGGTPFVDDAIKISEIRARRTGWRALLQRLINVDVRSQLEIRAVPVGKMSMKSQQHIYMLPTTIIIAKADISLVRTYRELLAVRIHSGRLDVNAQPMRGHSSSSSDPVLALFPRIIGDRAMRSVLHMHWARAVRALSFAERQNPMAYCHILSETIMRMWPAYCIHTARPNVLSGRSTESAEGVRDRMRLIGRMIKDPGSGTQIRHPNGSTGTTSPSIPSLLSTTLRGLPGAASASFTTGASPLHLTAENDETVHSAFHTKEVVFEVSSESSTRIGS